MAEQKEVLEIYQAMEKVVGEAWPVNFGSLVNEAGGPEQVALVQGFTREGPLASPRVAALIEPITKLAEEALRLGVGITVIRDAHSEDCPEFDQFGCHCVKGSAEAELVPELKAVLGPNYIDWPKNCLAAGQTHAQATVIDDIINRIVADNPFCFAERELSPQPKIACHKTASFPAKLIKIIKGYCISTRFGIC